MSSINIRVDSIEDLQGIKKRIKKVKLDINRLMIKIGVDYREFRKKYPTIDKQIEKIKRVKKKAEKKDEQKWSQGEREDFLTHCANLIDHLRFLKKLKRAVDKFTSGPEKERPQKKKETTIKNHLGYLSKKHELQSLQKKLSRLQSKQPGLFNTSHRKRKIKKLSQKIDHIKEALKQYEINSRGRQQRSEG